MEFLGLLALISVVAGAVASVSGFGIGSLLTPALAMKVDTKLAVAAVSIPHVIGTAFRCWMLRKDIDRKVLIEFGLASAAGGLAGALAHAALGSPSLTVLFGVILIFAGLVGITGVNERINLRGTWALVAGILSGALGGLVGNQGGIRSAGLLGFELKKDAFVATATAIGLIVDCVRMPVYLATHRFDLLQIWVQIAVCTAGVLVGTVVGMNFLRKVDEKTFKRVVSVLIVFLGIWMLFQRETS